MTNKVAYKTINTIPFSKDFIGLFVDHEYDDYHLCTNFDTYSVVQIIKKMNQNNQKFDKRTHHDIVNFENKLLTKFVHNIITIPHRSVTMLSLKNTVTILSKYFNNKDNINLYIGNNFNDISLIANMNDKHNQVVLDTVIFKNKHSIEIRQQEDDGIMAFNKINKIRKLFGTFMKTQIFDFENIKSQLPINTYDNIIIKCIQPHRTILSTNFYYQFPHLLSQITLGLSVLKNNGNMVIQFSINDPLPCFVQLIEILNRLFKFIEINEIPNSYLISLECSYYDSSFFSTVENNLWNIISNFENLDYVKYSLNINNIVTNKTKLFYENKNISQSISQKQTLLDDIDIASKLRNITGNSNIVSKKSKKKSRSKSIKRKSKKHDNKSHNNKLGGGNVIHQIVYDLKLNIPLSSKALAISSKLKHHFYQYFNNVNYLIVTYLPYSKQSLNDIVTQKLYMDFRMLFANLTEGNIIYNNEYINLMYNLQHNYINDVLILSNNIHFEILSYDGIKLKLKSKSALTSKSKSKQRTAIANDSFSVGNFLNSTNKIEPLTAWISEDIDNSTIESSYSVSSNSTSLLSEPKGFDGIKSSLSAKSNQYKEITRYYTRLDMVFRRREKLEIVHGAKYSKQVLELVEDFKGGIKHYLNKRFKLEHKMSNAFTKLWEIYHTFKILPNKSVVRTFHFAEAPGQFIWTTSRYLNKRVPDNKQHLWKANSLNPFNAKVIKEYKSVFNDTYKFMRNNPKNWLWGDDNTGDITHSKNIKSFKYELIKWAGQYPIDCLTGDGGLSSSSNVKLLQHLDYAQLCVVAACCSPNKHCVVKTFLPFITGADQAIESTGLYIGILYIYSLLFKELHLFKPYSSDPTSGEFYIIGKHFIGIDSKHLDVMYQILDNFKLNQNLIARQHIPDYFKKQFYRFIDVLSYYNTRAIERQNFLIECIADNLNTEKCNDYLDKTNIQKIKEIRYSKWVELFKFK
jgi:hypothetical protein